MNSFIQYRYCIDYCCYDTVDEALKEMPRKLFLFNVIPSSERGVGMTKKDVLQWQEDLEKLRNGNMLEWKKELNELCERQGYISSPENFVRSNELRNRMNKLLG